MILIFDFSPAFFLACGYLVEWGIGEGEGVATGLRVGDDLSKRRTRITLGHSPSSSAAVTIDVAPDGTCPLLRLGTYQGIDIRRATRTTSP